MLPTITQLSAVVDALDAPSAALKVAMHDLLAAVAQERAARGQPFTGDDETTFVALREEVS